MQKLKHKPPCRPQAGAVELETPVKCLSSLPSPPLPHPTPVPTPTPHTQVQKHTHKIGYEK